MSGEGRMCTSPDDAVDDDGIARIDDAGGIGDLADRRDAERAGDDRDVRGRPALLEDEAAQPPAVVVEQAPPAPSSARPGWRSPAAARAPARGPGRSAGASAGWRDRRGRAAGRADRDR